MVAAVAVFGDLRAVVVVVGALRAAGAQLTQRSVVTAAGPALVQRVLTAAAGGDGPPLAAPTVLAGVAAEALGVVMLPLALSPTTPSAPRRALSKAVRLGVCKPMRALSGAFVA